MRSRNPPRGRYRVRKGPRRHVPVDSLERRTRNRRRLGRMDEAHLEADRIFGPCNDPTCPGSRLRAVPDPDERPLSSREDRGEQDSGELLARVVELTAVDRGDGGD